MSRKPLRIWISDDTIWESVLFSYILAFLLLLMWRFLAQRLSLAWSFAGEAQRLRNMRRNAVRETWREKFHYGLKFSPFILFYAYAGWASSKAFGGHNIDAVNLSTTIGLVLFLYWAYDWTWFQIRNNGPMS